MIELLKKFEKLCIEEKNLLKIHGIDGDVTDISNEKQLLFKEINAYLTSQNLTVEEKEIIESIKRIQSESEKLYEQILSNTKKIIQNIKINKDNLTKYKINSSKLSSFLDHSG